MIGDAARLSLKVLSNMNQEPESIWKKKWRVWRAFLIWFALFIFIVLGMMLIAGSAQEPPSPRAIFVAGIIGASVLLCLWLFGHWSTRCWRNLRRTLLGLAILATLIAMFYTEENWRGKRVWESCKRALETKFPKSTATLIVIVSPSIETIVAGRRSFPGTIKSPGASSGA